MMQHIHLVGIGGTGMGPLAKIFIEMGCKVSGSDLQQSETTDYLQKLGALIHFGHCSSNLNGATSLVYSSAIPMDNPEVLAARERGIPVLHRSEMLAAILNEKHGIAVGGAHGKTTITSMISWIMDQAGLDPTVLIGARFSPFGPGAKFGEGKFVVAEADESDRSFLRYHSAISVVTSIEADHLENYNGAFQELIDGYQQFLENRKPGGIAVLGIDDKIVKQIYPRIPNAISFGFDPEATFRGEVVSINEGSISFNTYHNGQFFGNFQLNVPGRHNVANALAAIAVCHTAGLTPEQIRAPLAEFKGAQRRFQVLGEEQGVMIVDDYAHHPTEIAATLKAIREGWQRRVVAVFQPHRYSRTHFLMEEFARAFQDTDVLVLTDIYAPPPEKPIPGVSSQVLADKIRSHGRAQVELVPNRDDVVDFLVDFVKPNDLVITMGAGSIWRSAHELLARLRSV